MIPTFEEQVSESIRTTILTFLRKGEWLSIDFATRPRLDAGFLNTIIAGLDRTRIAALVREKCEERIADAIYNGLATELASDTKRLLSDGAIRGEIRVLLRNHMTAAVASIQEPK